MVLAFSSMTHLKSMYVHRWWLWVHFLALNSKSLHHCLRRFLVDSHQELRWDPGGCTEWFCSDPLSQSSLNCGQWPLLPCHIAQCGTFRDFGNSKRFLNTQWPKLIQNHPCNESKAFLAVTVCDIVWLSLQPGSEHTPCTFTPDFHHTLPHQGTPFATLWTMSEITVWCDINHAVFTVQQRFLLWWKVNDLIAETILRFPCHCDSARK